MNRWHTLPCAVFFSLLFSLAFAQESERDDAQGRKARLQLMQEAIGSFKTADDGEKSPARFVTKPLLRYSDPTRGIGTANVLLDAGVWRLGEKGRPLALVTLEIYGKASGDALLSYEFLAMVDAKLSLTHRQEKTVTWTSRGKDALSMSPLPEAPTPAATVNGRLVQMRQFARRFRVHETTSDGEVECRLLAQPIDRYQDGAVIVDGAIFAYANGTNPEAGIVLECSSERWVYGVIRLSSAELQIELDGSEVAHLPAGDFRLARDSNYSAAAHPVKLE
jgi:hypothetical protein